MKEYEELRKLIDGGSESMTHADAVEELKTLVKCGDLLYAYMEVVCRIKQLVDEAEDDQIYADDDDLNRELGNLFVIYSEALGGLT
jgi:hypothetical protein